MMETVRNWLGDVGGCLRVSAAVFMAAMVSVVSKPVVGRQELYQLAGEVLQQSDTLSNQTSTMVCVLMYLLTLL